MISEINPYNGDDIFDSLSFQGYEQGYGSEICAGFNVLFMILSFSPNTA